MWHTCRLQYRQQWAGSRTLGAGNDLAGRRLSFCMLMLIVDVLQGIYTALKIREEEGFFCWLLLYRKKEKKKKEFLFLILLDPPKRRNGDEGND